MSSSRRDTPTGQHRSPRKPRLRLALTGAAALAVLGGGTAFACLGVPHHESSAAGTNHGTFHTGPQQAAQVTGASAAPSAMPSATFAPLHRTPPAHPSAKPIATHTAAPKPISTPAPTAGSGSGAGANSGDAVQQVLALMNRNRAAQGLAPYTLLSGLDKSAAAHNAVMAGGCGLSHQCPGEAAFGDRENTAGVQWTSAGENIGEGGGISDTATAIAGSAVGLTQSMLDEKAPDDGHRRNILSSSFTHVGIAIYRDSSGTVWMTQDFSN
jgi:uncharacterized protein YkwD